MKLIELAKIADCTIFGNADFEVEGVCEISESATSKLCLAYEEKYFSLISSSQAGCFFVSEKSPYQNYPEYTFLVSKKPKFDLIKILSIFDHNNTIPNGISNLAYLSPSSKIGNNVTISSFVHISDNVLIEENVKIYPHVFIGANSFIGKNTILYPNVSILSDSSIGNNVIIHSGSVIGSDGYSYVQDHENNHHKIPQIGNVIVEDNVEIGANVCIDRGAINSTVIKRGTKIDNLVHIAHNVKVGEKTLLIAQSGIAGSSKIGNNCIIAGQVGIAGHIELGEKTYVLAKSGVTKNFKGGKISGFPARDHNEELKNEVFYRKIPKLFERIEELENKIKNIMNPRN